MNNVLIYLQEAITSPMGILSWTKGASWYNTALPRNFNCN